jgi:V/A-type H+-transporting ATPase subunit C
MNYVVLRTHARIPDILTEETMTELAQSDDIHELLNKLKDTTYGEITLETEERVPIVLERIFYQKFIQRIQQIVKLTPTKIGDFLRAYYDMRFEVTNLKRIIRGKFSGISGPEIKLNLIPMEPYLAPDHEKLAELDTIDAVIDSLGNTPYSNLKEQLKLFHDLDALWPFELTLNSIYADTILQSVTILPKTAKRMIDRIVKLETDVENILFAIKQREESETQTNRIQEMFPITFQVSIEQLTEIARTPNLRLSIEGLEDPYKNILSPIHTGDVALIRTALRQNKYEIAKSARASDEFGFNVIMAYLIYSELEKDNLVGLVWGKAQGLLSDELLKYIVVPRI